MAYVPVPKDLSKVKNKIIFNLTKRQLICFGLAGLFGIPVFFLARTALPTDISVLFLIIVALPFFLLAILEINDLPLEKYLKNYIETKFLRPAIRTYKTENFYAVLSRPRTQGGEVKGVCKNSKNISKQKAKRTRK